MHADEYYKKGSETIEVFKDRKIPKTLGHCIPGDIVEIDGEIYKVTFTMPSYMGKKWKKNGKVAETVFLRRRNEETGKERKETGDVPDKQRIKWTGPHPFCSETPYRLLSFRGEEGSG